MTRWESQSAASSEQHTASHAYHNINAVGISEVEKAAILNSLRFSVNSSDAMLNTMIKNHSTRQYINHRTKKVIYNNVA